jgi:hypothetical protein
MVIIANIVNKSNATISVVFVDGKAFCFCLQDEERDTKVKGDTRIWDGDYILKMRREVTPLTARYRRRADLKGLFDFFIEITGIKNFSHVYFHIGNTTADTAGCPLVGYTANFRNDTVAESAAAFKDWYSVMRPKFGKDGSGEVPCRVVTITENDLLNVPFK